MPNAYTVVPSVVPGQLTVGGDLDVKGKILVGAFTPRLRLQVESVSQANFSWNLDATGPRDDLSRPAQRLVFGDASAPDPRLIRYNAAGNFDSQGLETCILSDYTAHTNTGDTVEHVQVSKTIRSHMIGANGGLRVRVSVTSNVQGAGTSVVRVKVGATMMLSFVMNATGVYIMEGVILNRNAENSQYCESSTYQVGGAMSGSNQVQTIDTSADTNWAVTLQGANATDSQTLNAVAIHLLNSFGPVT